MTFREENFPMRKVKPPPVVVKKRSQTTPLSQKRNPTLKKKLSLKKNKRIEKRRETEMGEAPETTQMRRRP